MCTHAQPEVAQYPPQWGLLTGSDVSHVTRRGPVRKYVLCMPGFFPRFFPLSSTVVTWLPDVIKGHLTPSGKLHNTPSDLRSRDPFGSVLGVLSTTSASYDHRKPSILYLAWLLELALVICPFYFHIVSIQVVQYSNDGIFKSQMNEMVNLISTSIVSSNYD